MRYWESLDWWCSPPTEQERRTTREFALSELRNGAPSSWFDMNNDGALTDEGFYGVAQKYGFLKESAAPQEAEY